MISKQKFSQLIKLTFSVEVAQAYQASAEAWAKAWAEAEAEAEAEAYQASAKAWAKAEAKASAEAWAKAYQASAKAYQASAEAEAEASAEASAKASAKAYQASAKAWAKAEAEASAEAWAKAYQASAEAEASAEAWAKAYQASAEAYQASAKAWAKAEAKASAEAWAKAYQASAKAYQASAEAWAQHLKINLTLEKIKVFFTEEEDEQQSEQTQKASEAENTQLKEKNTQLEQNINQIQTQKDKIIAQNNTLNQENTNLKTELNNKEGELKSSKEEHQQQINGLEQEKIQMEIKINQLNRELEKKKDFINPKNDAERKKHGLKTQVEFENETSQSEEKWKNRLKEEKLIIEKLENQLTNKEQKIEKITQNYLIEIKSKEKELQKTKDNYEKKLKTEKTLRKNIEKLHQELTKIAVDKALLEKEIKDLEKELKELEKLRKQSDSDKKKIQEHRIAIMGKLTKLRDQVKVKEGDEKEIQEEIEALGKDLENLKEKVNEIINSIEKKIKSKEKSPSTNELGWIKRITDVIEKLSDSQCWDNYKEWSIYESDFKKNKDNISESKVIDQKDKNKFHQNSEELFDLIKKRKRAVKRLEDEANRQLKSKKQELLDLKSKEQKAVVVDIFTKQTQIKPDLKHILGRGGYGEVHYGEWKSQEVAVKKLYLSLPNALEIKKEIDILKKLKNRHIIQYYGTYLDKQELLIIMDYAENGTLTNFINDNKDKEHDWKLNNELIRQMVRGLAYIHHENIIHRDLKSLNILLTNNHQQVKISDFGLSRVKDISFSFQPKDIRGTLGWVAPEVLRGENCSEQSDIYALGMIMWEISAKCTTPFKDIDDPRLYIISNRKEEIPNDTPENIQDIIRQCWNDPNQRITLVNILEIIGVNESELQTINDGGKPLENENLSEIQSGEEIYSKSLAMDFIKDNQTEQEEIVAQVEQPPYGIPGSSKK